MYHQAVSQFAGEEAVGVGGNARVEGGQGQTQGQPDYETYDCEQFGMSAMSAQGPGGAAKRSTLAAKRRPRKTKRIPNQ